MPLLLVASCCQKICCKIWQTCKYLGQAHSCMSRALICIRLDFYLTKARCDFKTIGHIPTAYPFQPTVGFKQTLCKNRCHTNPLPWTKIAIQYHDCWIIYSRFIADLFTYSKRVWFLGGVMVCLQDIRQRFLEKPVAFQFSSPNSLLLGLSLRKRHWAQSQYLDSPLNPVSGCCPVVLVLLLFSGRVGKTCALVRCLSGPCP